jgi:hypothetical protein
MDIYRAEKIAQDRMQKAGPGEEWDRTFILIGPGVIQACKWLDPYMGAFTVHGKGGFMLTRDVPADFHVVKDCIDRE